MAKVNYLQVKDSAWGFVVSSILRVYASSPKAEESSIEFDNLDVKISFNGQELSDDAMETVIKILNAGSMGGPAASLRTSFSELLETVVGDMATFSPSNQYANNLETMRSSLRSVDLSYLVDSAFPQQHDSDSGSYRSTLDAVRTMQTVLTGN